MKVTADTNVLVRAVVRDNLAQTAAAQAVLAGADLVALTLTALTEFVWVLSRRYKLSSTDVALVLRQLTQADNVVFNRPAVEFGIAMLENGADFADGLIAFDGRLHGGDMFVSFDQRAITAARGQGMSAQRP